LELTPTAPTVYWGTTRDDSALEGLVWTKSDDTWQSQNQDLYLIIKAAADGALAMLNPEQYKIYDSQSILFDFNYIEPDDGFFNEILIEIKDYYTGESIQDFHISLSGENALIGLHTDIQSKFEINRPGFFTARAKIINCSVNPCRDGAETSLKYFSIRGAPLPAGILLNQTDDAGGSVWGRSDLGLVGQVFKLEKSGPLGSITMKLLTSGSYCGDITLSVYNWLSDTDETTPADGRGELLSQSGPVQICHNTAYPWPGREFVWNFDTENPLNFEAGKYYYLELSRNNVTSQWYGSPNGSLIDGRVWATDGYNNEWQSPPSYSELRDLYLIIKN